MRTYRLELISGETDHTVCAQYVEGMNEHDAVVETNQKYAPHFEVDRETVVEVLNDPQ